MNLYDAIEKHRDTVFEWGSTDCCRFVASVLEETTGRDYSKGFRYRSKRGALRLMKKHDGVEGIATKAFGESVPITHARRGDPVLATDVDVEGDALGICDGDGAVFMTEKGFVRIPLSRCKVAWRV